MKVLAIALGSGVQWRLMFETGGPTWNEAREKIADHGELGRRQIIINDDYGQSVSFWLDEKVSFLLQDTVDLDKLEVEMMLRQKRNENTALTQLQSDPRNMLVRGGGFQS